MLGKRTGHEQPLPRTADERPAALAPARTIDLVPEPREAANRSMDPKAEPGIRAVIQGEPAFDVGQFVEGAKAAYRMTLEAFWQGDQATLEQLAEPDVAHAFAEAIAARSDAGHRLDNRLVSIERAVIVDAEVSGREARITVRFDADIAAVTRDGEDNVVAGSLTDADETHDLWTFARMLKSGDPNWRIADTDEE